MTYDGADRHLSTTTGATVVSYDRDATDRIVARRVNGAVVATYGFSGPGDSPAMVTAATGVAGITVTSRFVALLGGASIHKGVTGGDKWSYPNIHGDTIVTANALGLEGPTLLTEYVEDLVDVVPMGTLTASDPIVPSERAYGSRKMKSP